MMESLRIALVATEASPLARHGGRGDVIAAVAHALAQRGHRVTLFLPAYRDLKFPAGARRTTVVSELRVPGPAGVEPAALIQVALPGGKRAPQLMLVDIDGGDAEGHYELFFDIRVIEIDPQKV